MFRYSLTVVLSYVLAALAIDIFAYTGNNGQTKLVGSSFGQIGVNATFDYVIVGGGTSGLTVALRLAQNSTASVAVIEGGSFYEMDNSNISQIPALDTSFSSSSPSTIQPLVDWGIITVPQPQLNSRQIAYTQGKCFGGGSSRNYIAYHRGTEGTYQQWADDVGDSSYTFSNLLPFFKKSCNFTPPNYSKRSQSGSADIGTVSYDPSVFSSSGGPLHVSYQNYVAPITNAIQKAFSTLGLALIPGLNSGSLIGYAEVTGTIDPRTTTRSSSETAFLQQAVYSTSLQLYQRTLAQRILFDEKNTATGVHVVNDGVSYALSARKEVIVAAGVFRTPQLLMVSGIGPQATLNALGIPVVKNLPGVGQNLRDQPFFGVTYEVNVTTDSQLNTNPAFLAQSTSQYLTNQTGALTNLGGNFIGWEKLPASYRANLSASTLADLAKFPSDWPEIEILPLARTAVPVNTTNSYSSVTIAQVATTSVGNLTINSTDTSVNPLVNVNWLATQTDQEVAVQAFKRARQVGAATGITVGPEYSPGPSVQTDAQILNFIRSTLSPIHHATGTCSIGNSSNPNAVVDTHGRVYGVNSLRVVDASTFPLCPPGHIQATVYAIAEKRAADILNGR